MTSLADRGRYNFGPESYYPEVVNFSALPSVSGHAGHVYLVLNSQWSGIFYKRAGLYRSNGSSWTRMADLTTVSDEIFTLFDEGGSQDQAAMFECSSISAATTRVFTFPDASGTLALASSLLAGFMLDAGTPADHTLVRFDGTDGKTTQTTGIVVDDSDNMSGIGTIDSARITITDGGLLSTGTTDGFTIPSGAGTRLMWIPSKAAFRAGSVDGSQWNSGNIGLRSVVFGLDGTASGGNSVCFGINGTASGGNSTCFGNSGEASGADSVHFGTSGTASGIFSFHTGLNNFADAYAVMTLGRFSVATGAANPAVWANGDAIFVVGNGTSAGARATALTIFNDGNLETDGTLSIASGKFTVASNGAWAVDDGGATTVKWSLNPSNLNLIGERYFNSSAGVNTIFIRSRGTEGTPLSLNDNDTIFAYRFQIWNSLAGGSFTMTQTAFTMEADGNHGDGSTPTKYVMNTIPNGSVGQRPVFAVRHDGNIDVLLDDRGIRFGVGTDAQIYYDGADLVIDPALVGTGDVVIGAGLADHDYGIRFDGETNDGVFRWMEDEDYFKFEDDIALANAEFLIIDKASGNGIKVDTTTPTFGFADLLGEVFARNTGANKPTRATWKGGTRGFQFGVDDEEEFEFHIPHDYAKGTDIFLHLHWGHNVTTVTGGTVTFNYDATYAKGHNQGVFGANAVGTVVSGTVTSSQYSHDLSEGQFSVSGASATQIDTDDLEPDGVIKITLGVSANNITVSSGGVPEPFIHYVDIHYQTNGIIGTKSRTPDFYA